MLKIEAACICNIGIKRKNNEDNFFFNGQLLPIENNGLPELITLDSDIKSDTCLAVFDGIGGESFGEVAAATASEYLKNNYTGIKSLFSAKKTINNLCLEINNVVVEKAKEFCIVHMGTTMVALFFFRHNLYMCNLGDSRAYRFRSGKMCQISVDHVENKEGKRKSPLTQHLGIDMTDFLIEPYIQRLKIQKNDCFLICSDGLTDMIADSDIEEIMSNSGNSSECVKNLLEAALRRGGKDNITAVVCNII